MKKCISISQVLNFLMQLEFVDCGTGTSFQWLLAFFKYWCHHQSLQFSANTRKFSLNVSVKEGYFYCNAKFCNIIHNLKNRQFITFQVNLTFNSKICKNSETQYLHTDLILNKSRQSRLFLRSRLSTLFKVETVSTFFKVETVSTFFKVKTFDFIQSRDCLDFFQSRDCLDFC